MSAVRPARSSVTLDHSLAARVGLGETASLLSELAGTIVSVADRGDVPEGGTRPHVTAGPATPLVNLIMIVAIVFGMVAKTGLLRRSEPDSFDTQR